MVVSGSFVAGLSMAYFFYALLNRDGMLAQIQKSLDSAGPEVASIYTPDMLLNIVFVFCVLGVVEGMLCAMLGALILRGRRGAIVTSIAITALRFVIVGLLLLLVAVAAVLPGAALKWDGQMILSIALSVVSGVYLVWQMLELVLSWRETRVRP
jgi:hypothetical protein